MTVMRNRSLRKRHGDIPVRVKRPGKTRWTRGHAIWVSDVFAWRGSPAAWSEDIVQVTGVTLRSPGDEERHKLRRLGDDVQIAALSNIDGEPVEVATGPEERTALVGPFVAARTEGVHDECTVQTLTCEGDEEQMTVKTDVRQMKLKTGMDPTSRFNIKDTRGLRFHGMGAFVGTGRTQRAHVYTAAAIPVDPEAYKKIDPEKLAHELGVDMCAVNSGRFWMMDEITLTGGEVQDFHGVEMRWAGDMTGAEMISKFQTAYLPCLIYRNTNWTFYAGKPVYLLRDPEGSTWVLQEFTQDVDPSLEADNLEVLGEQVQGAAGRLDVRDQGARREPLAGHVSRRRLGRDHPRRAPLHLPGLRLRRRHQCELHPVTEEETMTTATHTGRPIVEQRQTSLELYVTAKEAYDMWQADPEGVKVLDVRTPEEWVFTGHAPMATNIPFALHGVRVGRGEAGVLMVS